MLPKILLTLPHILRVLDNYFLYFLFLGDCLGIFWVQAGDVYLNNTIYIYGTPNLLIDMVPHLYLYIVHSKDIPPSYRVLQNKQKQDKKKAEEEDSWTDAKGCGNGSHADTIVSPTFFDAQLAERILCIHSQLSFNILIVALKCELLYHLHSS